MSLYCAVRSVVIFEKLSAKQKLDNWTLYGKFKFLLLKFSSSLSQNFVAIGQKEFHYGILFSLSFDPNQSIITACKFLSTAFMGPYGPHRAAPISYKNPDISRDWNSEKIAKITVVGVDVYIPGMYTYILLLTAIINRLRSCGFAFCGLDILFLSDTFGSRYFLYRKKKLKRKIKFVTGSS